MKNFNKIKDRIEKLRKEVDCLRYRYHVLNSPEVTDELYTSLRQELKELEDQYPQFQSPHSPTVRIGGKPLDRFQKVKHLFQQWSLDDAFNLEDLKNWEAKNLRFLKKKIPNFQIKEISYIGELKIDGLHLVLTYEKGLLKTGATRGDGVIGEDITANVKTIESIPLKLKEPFDLVVEGECWLSKKELARLNSERKEKGLPLFANTRNAAAGSVRQLDPQVASSRKLESFLYDLHFVDNEKKIDQLQELAFLKRMGFKVNHNFEHLKNIQEIEKFYQKTLLIKEYQPYGVDGIVIKVNQKKFQEALGYTGKSPRFSIAYKFPAEEVTTIINAIEWQIGRTGALTPVALLKPIAIAGSVVKKASLHNYDEIKRLDIKIGDTVVLKKAGDVIPKITQVLKNLRTGKEIVIFPPKNCPQCRYPVVKKSINDKQREVALYCSNLDCFSKQKEAIIHFVSKKGFNIEGLGEKIISRLINHNLIQDAGDLFFLTQNNLLGLENFKEKKIKNTLQAIEKSKNILLNNLIVALGIRHVGEEMAIVLADIMSKEELALKIKQKKGFLAFQDFICILQRIIQKNLEGIEGVGEKIAKSLKNYFTDLKNKDLFDKLEKAQLKIQLLEIKVFNNQLVGKSFVITGTLRSLNRNEVKDKIRALGGKVVDSVSKKTDFLIAGEKPGSKLTKAQVFGIKILEEEDFLKMII